ncbi:MAG: hypothetical protein HC918_06505 [Oscillatoriales cyanobacterium SM2_1_8]|nr:hypothetical protein [Oscillatoriales cyanobacterium SM2_1_8]
MSDIGSEEVVAVCVNGIGNVLRHFCAARLLAVHFQRPFRVVIGSDRLSTATSNALCELLSPFGSTVITSREAGEKLASTLVNELEIYDHVGIYGTNSHPLTEAYFKAVLPPGPLPYLSIYAAQPRSYGDADIVRYKTQTYAQLPWPDALQQEVGAIAHRLELSERVGVHIRLTDNLTDALKTAHHLNTPLEVFLEFLAYLALHEDARFFVCTDNPQVVPLLQEMEFDVVTPPLVPPPLSQELLEMHLLSQTRYLVGSYSSTFSYEAAFLAGGKRLWLWEKEAWQLYDFCPCS